MRVLLSTYGARGDVEPMVGLAVQLRALGAEELARVGVPPRSAKLVAAQFDTAAAVAEECDAPDATGVVPTGAWR